MAVRRPRVNQKRIAETVAADLRERILAGEEHLPTQDQLVEEFGVSYPSVREALRILETEGLVTVRRGNVGGAIVHRPDEASAGYHLGLALQGARVPLRDLADGLKYFEPMCAGECARREDRAEAVVPVLMANIEASAAAVSAGPEFTRVAREFHDLLVELTPNLTVRFVVGSLVSLWSAQEELWAENLARQNAYPPSPGDAEAVLKTHRRIVTEIAAGRAAEAEKLARAHLVAAQSLVLERFEDHIVQAANERSTLRPRRSSGL